MIQHNEVMHRIKTILSCKIQKDKILDKDIAIALAIDPQYYAVMKRRKKIPYRSIAYFSREYNINMNWILFEQKPQYLT